MYLKEIFEMAKKKGCQIRNSKETFSIDDDDNFNAFISSFSNYMDINDLCNNDWELCTAKYKEGQIVSVMIDGKIHRGQIKTSYLTCDNYSYLIELNVLEKHLRDYEILDRL